MFSRPTKPGQVPSKLEREQERRLGGHHPVTRVRTVDPVGVDPDERVVDPGQRVDRVRRRGQEPIDDDRLVTQVPQARLPSAAVKVSTLGRASSFGPRRGSRPGGTAPRDDPRRYRVSGVVRSPVIWFT